MEDFTQEKIRVIPSQNIAIHNNVFLTVAWKLALGRKVNFIKLTVDCVLHAESIPRVYPNACE